MSNVEKAVQRVSEGVKGFATEMREKGIHVGMGSDPHCVTCGEKWPCPTEVWGFPT